MEKLTKQWCPGCDQEVNLESMVSLDGLTEVICEKCWDGLRPFERILLVLLSTCEFYGSNGGPALGIGFELDTIRGKLNRLLKKLFKGHREESDGV